MLKAFFAALIFAVTTPPQSSTAVNARLQEILASATVQPAPSATPSVAIATTQAPSCVQTEVQPSRYLRYAAQFVNALIVGNAVHRGSQGRVLGSASPLGFIGEYALLDTGVDLLDRRTSCDVQAKINAIFGIGALYNAAQTEFPKQ